MPNRELSFAELKRVLEAHGCTVELNRNNYLKVTIGVGVDHRFWFQQAHKGRRDTFRPRIVREARRALGFESMGDEEFYAPL
jgi:hypothetical protein